MYFANSIWILQNKFFDKLNLIPSYCKKQNKQKLIKMFLVYSSKTIQDLHNDLMLSSETLGSLYSWSLLFWLGNLSIHSVSNLYFIIDWVILTPWTNIAWPLIINMWCWLIGFITQLLALHIACDYTINEVVLIFFKYYNSTKDKPFF